MPIVETAQQHFNILDEANVALAGLKTQRDAAIAAAVLPFAADIQAGENVLSRLKCSSRYGSAKFTF